MPRRRTCCKCKQNIMRLLLHGFLVEKKHCSPRRMKRLACKSRQPEWGGQEIGRSWRHKLVNASLLQTARRKQYNGLEKPKETLVQNISLIYFWYVCCEGFASLERVPEATCLRLVNNEGLAVKKTRDIVIKDHKNNTKDPGPNTPNQSINANCP